MKSDFNLMDSFRLFDVKGLGSFNSSDLAEALRLNLGMNDFNSDDIYMFFRRVDF